MISAGAQCISDRCRAPGSLLTSWRLVIYLDREVAGSSPNMPPTLLVQAEDEGVNDVYYSLFCYLSLKNAGVPVEMHFYAQGGHAFGLRCAKLPHARVRRSGRHGTISLKSPAEPSWGESISCLRHFAT
jgi:acetyl esterase/lipase